MKYSNFDLSVDLESGGLRIEARPETGERAGPIRSVLPSFAKNGPGAEEREGRREVGSSDRAALQKAREKGSELFRAVFREQVSGLWFAALARAREKRTGVRLRLHLSAELWDWPWERLFDDSLGFLAHFTNPPVSIVRFIDGAAPPPPFRGALRVRVLVVAAQPRDQEPPDVEKEWREIQRGLAGLRRSGRVHLERLDHPTLRHLEEKLSSGTLHVLHFIGHGGFCRAGEGLLYLEDEEGGPVPVNGLQLGALLKLQPSLRLVVLNACEGARDGARPFAGVAQSLVRLQVPAVIAMKHPIRDRDAIRFSRRFYAGLARGGAVDCALRRALLGLQADHPESEWSTPVLYLREADGRLFPCPWKQIAAIGLSPLLVALAFIPFLIDPGAPSYHGPPEPPLPEIASTEGCPRSELLGMTFVRIPKGTFTMGSKSWAPDERRHRVTISQPFCMARYEVTRAQWRTVMGTVPGEEGQDDRLPVTEVSWQEIGDFLKKLNELEPGSNYRRPTEAQWEYAARGGSPTDFSFGDDPSVLYFHGNCQSGKVEDGYDGLAPVGSFQPNLWGLYDMHGNASEWVGDWYGPYPKEHQTDPKGPPAGTEKVRRGGSFGIIPKNCDAVQRNKSEPGYKNDDVGFRLVRPVRP